MLLVAIAWLYVVLMIAVVQATGGGTLVGAAFTLLLYGMLPVALLGYLFFSPARRRARRAADAEAVSADASSLDPDRRDHPAGDAVPPVREEA
jgi:hypothetical protein